MYKQPPPANLSQIKHTLRSRFLQQRHALSDDFKNTASWKIWNHLRTLVAQHNPGVVAVYQPIHGEVDVLRFAEELAAAGVVVALPRCVQRGHPLVFNVWRPGEKLDFDVLNIPCAGGDVVVPHMVVLPLLAFTREGHRLGYGGGFYDVTLPQLPSPTVRVGVAYACQQTEGLPHEEHDQKMHYIITESEVIPCPQP